MAYERQYGRLGLGAALLLAASAWAFSAGSETAAAANGSSTDPAPPNSLQNTSLVERLNQSGTQDKLALEVAPYEDAPVHIESEATASNALKPSSYPPIAQPVNHPPDSETQALSPIAP